MQMKGNVIMKRGIAKGIEKNHERIKKLLLQHGCRGMLRYETSRVLNEFPLLAAVATLSMAACDSIDGD